MASIVSPVSAPNSSPSKTMASSKLKSIIAPRNHRRSPSDGTNLSPSKSPTKKENANPHQVSNTAQPIFLPSDHPHNEQHLREQGRNQDNARSSPRKPIAVYEDQSKSSDLHKRTKSSVSLKSLVGNDKAKPRKTSSPEKQDRKKPKKIKSSTGLSALLSRSKSSTDLTADEKPLAKDKENTTPPSTGKVAPPPIWAQFASQPFEGYASSTKVPLNDVRNVAEEIALYTPTEYSPSKGRNFMDYGAPTLSRKLESKPRSKSTLLPSSASKTSFTETISALRKRGQTKDQPRPLSGHQQYRSSGEGRRLSLEKTAPSQRASAERQRKSEDAAENDARAAKRGSRVMAAVAAFNGKTQGTDVTTHTNTKALESPLDPETIETAFESLLVSYSPSMWNT